MKDHCETNAIEKIKEASRLLKEARKELYEDGFYLKWEVRINTFREQELPIDLKDMTNKVDPIDSVRL
jgi:hypothetical protein